MLFLGVPIATPPSIQGPVDLDLGALTPFLSEALGEDLSGRITHTLMSGGRSNPTYELTDGHRAWILRRPPYGEVLKSAHDVMRESQIVSSLRGSDVPVPSVVATCADPDVLGAPFYVMDKIEGRTLRTHADTALLTKVERAGLADSLVKTLVALHRVDPDTHGLGGFGRPVGYMERQLQRWARQWDVARTREGDGVSELTRRLARSMPELQFPGIVHGDYKIDNVMIDASDPTRIVALLDWEMATLGDTLADLGQLISFWDEPGGPHNPITAGATAHPGFPAPHEVVEMYAKQRQVDLGNIEWYIVFADLKLAVILEQIHARHIAGQTVGDWFDDIGDMVPQILERALERASSAQDPRLRGRRP